MRSPLPISVPGPWKASDVRPGEVEISEGHRIECVAKKKALAVSTDPAVKVPGVEIDFSPNEQTLRAPDFSVLAEPLATLRQWNRRAIVAASVTDVVLRP